MQNEKDLTGRHIVLTEPARWRNAGEEEAREIPAGTVLLLDSHRPEGYMAWIPDRQEGFFLFSKYIRHAVIWTEEGHEQVTRIPSGPAADCHCCGEDLGRWEPRYIHINAGGGAEILCADCAAILLGESSNGIIWEQVEVSPADAVCQYLR